MGSKVSKTPRSQATKRQQSRHNRSETSRSIQTGTFSQNGKLRAKPPKISREELLSSIDFDVMDDIALQVPGEMLLKQFWRLVEYLIVTPDGDVVSDLLKIRAIYRWIMSYDILNMDTDIIPPDDSILEYFMKIQCDLADHSQLLYTLCLLADIPCVIINGMTKSNMYEVGGEMDREAMAAQWNAVYIENEWRLIDCFWSAVCVDSRTSSDYITVSKNGQVNRIFENEDELVPFNDFYFLVDPDVLVWTHYPDDEEWQLLEKPISREEFERGQYLREQFHLLGMSIPEHWKHSCVIESRGECVDIMYKLPTDRSGFYKFAYTLCQSRNQVDTNQPVDVLLERFVFLEHSSDKVKFSIRFPFPGLFQMDIYAADLSVSKTYKLISSYVITCKELETPFLPFPDCPDLGWGPNPVAERAGIKLIKPKESGMIRTSTGIIELTFQVKNIGFISHSLKSFHLNEALLSRHIYSRSDKDKYIINIRLPKEGEYALKIFVGNGEGLREYMPSDIMHFLIVFDEDSKTNLPFPYIVGGHIGTKPYAEQYAVEILSYPNGLVKAWQGKTRLEFETRMKNITLIHDLCGCLREAHSRAKTTVNTNEDQWVFDIELPVPGEYSMNVFAMLEDGTTLYEVQSYLITSVVQNSKRVKFEDDFQTEDIITATIRTSDENVTIPIPRADENEKIFSRMYRKDGQDGENGRKPVIVNTGESFEINIKEDGEYEMDVWVQDEEEALETVAKFSICRRPSIESYSDDIDALVRMLKPQDESNYEGEDDEDEYDEGYDEDEGSVDENNTGEDKEDVSVEGNTETRNSVDDDEENDEPNSRPLSEVKNMDQDGDESMAPKKEESHEKEENEEHLQSQPQDSVDAENQKSAETNKPKESDQKSLNESVFEDNAAAILIVANENDPKRGGKKVKDNKKAVSKTKGRKASDPGENIDHGKDEESDRMEERFQSRRTSLSSTTLGLVAEHVIHEHEKAYDNESLVESSVDGSITHRSSVSSTSTAFMNQPENEMDEHQRERFREAKRRIVKRKLHKAIKERKLKDLVLYFKEYKDTSPPQHDELRKEAKKIINFLQAKENLIEATLSKDPEVLRKAILRAQKNNLNMSLTVQILLATRILERLNRIRKISSTVLEMNQNSVTEMKKYATPPNGVHQSLAATLLLLGENSNDLKDWKTCQSFLFKTGKDSLMRKVSGFDPHNVELRIKEAAQRILGPFSLVQVRDVSKGAAAFFTWSSSMIEEIESYRNSMRKSGKTSAKQNRPRSATFREFSARREGTVVMRI